MVDGLFLQSPSSSCQPSRRMRRRRVQPNLLCSLMRLHLYRLPLACCLRGSNGTPRKAVSSLDRSRREPSTDSITVNDDGTGTVEAVIEDEELMSTVGLEVDEVNNRLI